jgi:glucose-6-phosphate isomerase
VSTLNKLIAQASGLTDCPSWSALGRHADEMSGTQLRELLEDSGRFQEFSRRLGDFVLDYSRNRINSKTLELLLQLAGERRLGDWIELLFAGENVNNTEGRPALHMALRHSPGRTYAAGGADVTGQVRAELDKMLEFASAVSAGAYNGHTGEPITDVVNIGIGGSDLGAVMVTGALAPYCVANIRTHFVSNIDGCQLADVLERVQAQSTLFVICSKSFSTLETQLNADAARAWFVGQANDAAVSRHFVAVSVNDQAMDRFGIDPKHRFRIWDWVGGRYSLWSAVGLSVAIALGAENFRALLAGAAEMDEHFRTAAPTESLPTLLGLIGVWNQNFMGVSSHAVLPYDQRLSLFPAFLQQLEMESNGKRVTRDGAAVDYPTGTVVWGEPGSNAQHSFFQLLHQGTVNVSMDFIAPVNGSSRFDSQHQQGLVNMLAQAEAFARGHHLEAVQTELADTGLAPANINRLAPHKVHPGNRPANLLLMKTLDPRSLGSLIALYEHKVFVQSVIWGINPFDQWGVELGKTMAGRFAQALSGAEQAVSLPGIATLMRDWREA